MREGVSSFDGPSLRAHRLRRHLSLDELARLAGVKRGRATLIEYEQGRQRPGPVIMVSLAIALGIDPIELTTLDRSALTLTEVRQLAGLGLGPLAEQLNRDPSTIRRIERGERTMAPELVSGWARALGADEATILRSLPIRREVPDTRP